MMLNVSRPVSNSLRQMTHPGPDASFRRHNCHILKVNYVSRRLKVSGHGYSGPKRVAVAQGISLGTPDNPIVTTSNIAEIERQADDSWLCIAIRRKQLCASGTAPTIDVISDNEFDPFYSAQTDDFGSIVTPDNLFMPPIESLGELSLPDERFLGGTTTLCGVPPCDDCGNPTLGMSPIFTADGCWKWDFRGASCGLYFGSQEVYQDYFPETDTRTLDQVVAVRENFAYIFSVNLTGDFTYGSPHLYVFDLSDPTIPQLVNDIEITIIGGGLFGLGVAVKEDVLWVSGTFTDNTGSSGIGDTLMYRYDISTRDTPTLVTSWVTRLINNYTPWLFFDVDTQTFTGQPYLVGFNWDYRDTSVCQSEFLVIDGLTGAEVQTVSGFTFGRRSVPDVFALLYTYPPLVCDNTVLVMYWDGSLPTVDLHILAIDMTAIPASIGTVWTSEDNMPFVYLGANHAYTSAAEGGVALLTQLDIDSTRTNIGSPFPLGDNSVQPWGYFLKGNCLLRTGQLETPAAWSANISNQAVPIMRSQIDFFYGEGGQESGRFADADIKDGHVYMANVGGGGQFAYLVTVFAP